MKNVSVLARVLLSGALSVGVVSASIPLASGGGGRTNHPVVFVHGINQGTSETWEVALDTNTAKIENAVVSVHFRNHIREQFGTAPITFITEAIASITYDVRISDQVLANQTMSISMAMWTVSSPSTITVRSAVYDQTTDEISVTFYNNSSGKTSINKKSAGLLTKSYTYTGMTKHPVMDPSVLDWVKSYTAGTAPYALAKQLGVSTAAGTGINSNGIYFFSSKVPDITFRSATSSTKVTKFSYTRNGPYPSKNFHVSYTYQDILTATFTVGGSNVTTTIDSKTCSGAGNVIVKTATAYPQQPKPSSAWHYVSSDEDYIHYKWKDSQTMLNFQWTTSANLSNVSGGVFPGWKLSAHSPAEYSSNQFSYGQPNQLYDRLVYILNDFYGAGSWQNNPNAVVDLVTFSQGGLIARLMIDKFSNTTLANPVNHINKIVMMDVPNLGSAAGTNTDIIGRANAITGQSFPVLGKYRDTLVNDAAIQDYFPLCNTNFDVPMKKSYMSAGASITVSAKSWLGPYQGGIHVHGGLTDLEIKGDRSDVPIPADPLIGMRLKLQDFFLYNNRLAWPEQSTFVKYLVDANYPTNHYTAQAIDVVTLCSSKSNRFFSSLYDGIFTDNRAILESTIRDAIIKMLNNGDPNKVAFIDVPGFASAIVSNLVSGLRITRNAFVALDKDWAERSDMVIEYPSQQGIIPLSVKPKTKWNVSTNADHFSTQDYANPGNITHIDFGALINPKLPSTMTPILTGYVPATRQYDRMIMNLCLPSNSPAPPPVPPVPQRIDVIPSVDDTAWRPTGVLTRVTDDTARKCARIECQFTNGMAIPLAKPSAKFYFIADSVLNPRATIRSSVGNVSIQRVNGALYCATITSGNVNVAPNCHWPQSSPFVFELSYSNSSPWQTWSAPSAGAQSSCLTSNSGVPLYDSVGYLCGVTPDTFTTFTDKLDASLMVLSKERNLSGQMLQPSLSVVNVGATRIDNFSLQYFFHDEKPFKLAVYWMARQANATVKIDTLGNNSYAVDVTYTNVMLMPGDRIDNIEFELSNNDWTAWYAGDDISYNGSGTLSSNWNIVALGDDGRYLWGDASVETKAGISQGQSVLALDARDEATTPDLVSPHIRISNTGTATQKGITFSFPLTGSAQPIVDLWDAPGATVTTNPDGAGNWNVYVSATA